MKHEPHNNQGQLFAIYAGSDLSRWQMAVGQDIVHKRFGRGQITGVHHSHPDSIIVAISFRADNQKKSLTASIFMNTDVIRDMTHPTTGIDFVSVTEFSLQEPRRQLAELQMRKEKQALELTEHPARKASERKIQPALDAHSREEFALLKDIYAAMEYREESPTSPLYPILLALEARNLLDHDQCQWLEEQDLHGPLACNLETEFDLTGDPWYLIKASHAWRSIKLPLRAIRATEQIKELSLFPRNVQAALLTTRGGAFRDINQLAEAEHCARNAMEIHPSGYHALNLIGAVYYDRGDPETGDFYFSAAIDRGAQQRSQETIVRGSIRKLDPSVQRSTAAYLLEKDPDRFRWARDYLR